MAGTRNAAVAGGAAGLPRRRLNQLVTLRCETSMRLTYPNRGPARSPGRDCSLRWPRSEVIYAPTSPARRTDLPMTAHPWLHADARLRIADFPIIMIDRALVSGPVPPRLS